MKETVLNNKLPYENYKVFHPDGTLMFFCAQKKVNWYLKRNLAKYISDKEIQLTFEPGGYGDPVSILEGRDNICVVSGDTTELTRHHVIPSQFRKHFELKYKDKNSCDIVTITRDLHNDYELHADVLKQKFIDEFIDETNKEINVVWYTAKTYYNTIKKHYHKLPPSKQIYLTMRLEGLIEKYNFNENDFVYPYSPYSDDINKLIVDAIGIENMIILWKYHFIKYAKPKHLPTWWKPNLIKVIHKHSSLKLQKSELIEVDIEKNNELKELLIKYDVL